MVVAVWQEMEWGGHAGDSRPGLPCVEMVSDASGKWGCGAAFESHWFQLKWQGLGNTQALDITAKELLPIVLAAAVWGQKWAGSGIIARCDNRAVVAIVNSGTSRESEAMYLRRCLAFLEARWSFVVQANHIRGVDNVVADALSRDKGELARSLMQEADTRPTSLPKRQ